MFFKNNKTFDDFHQYLIRLNTNKPLECDIPISVIQVYKISWTFSLINDTLS